MNIRQAMVYRVLLPCSLVALFGCASNFAAQSAELKLLLPLNRAAYQANEWIDISVIRASGEPLPAGELALALQAEDGSELKFLFPAKRVEAQAASARAVEHLHVNGWLLRPGRYQVTAICDGATAATNLTVHGAVRRTDFKLINWGRAQGKDQLAQGEDLSLIHI